jgi:hypothetical protein
MAIFNSYVKLPEGILPHVVDFFRILWLLHSNVLPFGWSIFRESVNQHEATIETGLQNQTSRLNHDEME